ncbi:MAG: hypothetical protein LC746_00310 [Acidobacteria bacterium]|nr:hypothetical protein [Acidobacteriota bacterium]
MAVAARAVDLNLRRLEEGAAVGRARQFVRARELPLVFERAAERADEVRDEEEDAEARERVEERERSSAFMFSLSDVWGRRGEGATNVRRPPFATSLMSASANWFDAARRAPTGYRAPQTRVINFPQ